MKQLQLDGEIMAMENPQTRWIGHCHVWDTTLQVQTTQLGVPAMATEEHEEYTKKMFHWNRMRPTRGGPQAILFVAGYASDFFRVALSDRFLSSFCSTGGLGLGHPMVPWPVRHFSVEVGRLICKNHNGCPLKHRLASLAPSCLVSVIPPVISVEEDDEGPRGFAT